VIEWFNNLLTLVMNIVNQGDLRALAVLFFVSALTEVGMPFPFVIDAVLVATSVQNGLWSLPVAKIVIALLLGRQLLLRQSRQQTRRAHDERLLASDAEVLTVLLLKVLGHTISHCQFPVGCGRILPQVPRHKTHLVTALSAGRLPHAGDPSLSRNYRLQVPFPAGPKARQVQYP